MRRGQRGQQPTIAHIQLPRPHAGQWRIVREARRWNCVVCGRRWGKTVLGINRLVLPALEGAPVAWMSPTYRMLAEVWREVTHLLRPVAVRVVAEQYRIELYGGGVVEMWSLEQPDTIRGRKYRRVVIDEAAMVRDLGTVWQMVIRPTLTDLRGDGWLLSTPKGRGFFWECFQRGQQPEGAWKSWQMPTSSNPFIAPDEIAAAQHELPERIFAQEYLAQFLDDAGGVFRRVHEAATATPQEHAIPGHAYVMGVDWGRSGDYSCFAVVDTTTRALVALDRCNQIDYALQLGRLAALAERFTPDVILAEQNSIGTPLIEQLQRAGRLPVQPFVTSNSSKLHIIEGLALALERGDLAILDDPILRGELEAYEMERLPSGMVRYSAPPGRHDDTVMALALAWHAAGSTGPLVLWE
ncbi:MAG: hypothetical protein HC876_19165 [Chloroflexaceae bacterium]|nr:hypothetical protein [Chloroflexaceae bacterium]NJO07456.1 hypothetical protein [Chloroflexaceae bacterium]